MLLGAAIFYFLFGTAERQFWADPLAGSGSSYYQRGTDTATVDTGSGVHSNGTSGAIHEVDGSHTDGSGNFGYHRWRDEPEESDLGAQSAAPASCSTSEPQVYAAGATGRADGALEERRKIRPDESEPRPYSATDAR